MHFDGRERPTTYGVTVRALQLPCMRARAAVCRPATPQRGGRGTLCLLSAAPPDLPASPHPLLLFSLIFSLINRWTRMRR